MATLEITTMVGCPVKCTFCPQETLKAKYNGYKKYLDLDDFKVVLNKVPRHVRIDFSGMAEPWANPNCTAMLQHTLEQGYRVAIYTTLYGLRPEQAPQVIHLLDTYRHQIEVIVLHLQDAQNNMRGLKFTDKWVATFNIFIDGINQGRVPNAAVMTMDASGELHPFLQSIGVRPAPFQAIDRAGSLDLTQIGAQPVQQRSSMGRPISCASTPYYDHNVLMPNGDVLLCCMDYSYKHKIGNLLQESYYDLFKGEVLRALVVDNMKSKPDKCSICRSCNNVTVL